MELVHAPEDNVVPADAAAFAPGPALAATSVPGPALAATSVPASALRTFLIADVRGYTRFSDEHGDEAAAHLVARFAAVMREGVAARGGHVLELRGDEALAVFGSARQALRAALDLQARFAQETGADLTLPLKVGMGLDAGEAVPVEGGYRGGALNLAARLCSLAGPGEVFASEELVHLARVVEGLRYVERGSVQLKGLAEPVRVIQILPEGAVPAHLPPLVAVVSRPSTLPVQPTPFIGRMQELAAVRALLRRGEARLVTLTGAGGSGKTRLALQVATQVHDAYADGVAFVSLAPLSDPALVASTIAQELGVKEAGGQPLIEALKGVLRPKQLLLMLDNFEQVLAAAPRVADLLAACPQLTVLVTSRAPLRLRGEQEYLVPPLVVPQPTQLPPLEVLSQYDAVRLFIERAQQVKPDFAMTNDNAPAVAEICARLDGLPLAIELAAAHIRMFPPQAMLPRLGSRLKLLTGGPRDLPTRQQTLRATIDWSHALLGPSERTLFARLAVFVGGRILEAIEAICNPDGTLDVLAGVESLLEKNLLRQEEGVGGEPRFVMLETLHEYARERLAASGEAAELRRRHAAYFLALAEKAEPKLYGPEQAVWLARLEAEHDNLRAVLQWAQQSGEGEIGLRVAAAVWLLWYEHGHLSEGQRWLEELLQEDISRSGLAGVRVKALYGAGVLAREQGDYVRAVSLSEESLALARDLGDNLHVAFALNTLGTVAERQADYQQAAAYFEDVLALARDEQLKQLTWGVPRALNNLARIARHQDMYERAAGLLEESLALARDEDSATRALVLGNLGHVARCREDYRRAVAFYEASLLLWQDLGHQIGVLECLEGLAGVVVVQGQMERAARLLGAAAAQRDAIGAPLARSDRTTYERDVAGVRAALGDEAFAAAWEAGRAMSLQQAIAEALEESH